MNTQNLIVSIGTGLTVAILVAVFVSYLFEPAIEFSVFVGIPAGLLAGVATMAAAAYLFTRKPTHPLTRTLPAIATFGYVLVGLYVIRVYLPISRQTLSTSLILAIAIIFAAAILGFNLMRQPPSVDATS